MKKRMIVVLLTVLLSLSALVPSQAVSNVPAISASSISANAGESVTVALTLSGNPGVSALVLTLKYDTDALTQTAVTNAGMFEHMDCDRNLVFFSPSDVTADGTIATLTFDVSERASGSYPIEIIIRETCNSAYEDVDFAALSGVVSVQNEGAFTVRVNGEEKIVKPGDILSISARSAYTERGLKYRFERWSALYATGEDAGAVISDPSRLNTTVKIPESSVDIVAGYYVLGDITGDGRVNLNDVIGIMRARVGYEVPGYTYSRADYNEDGKVNNRDILAMLLDIVNVIE